jgi:hypothetical protein
VPDEPAQPGGAGSVRPGADLVVGQRLPRRARQPRGPLGEAPGDLGGRVGDGPAHLAGQLAPDVVGALDHPRHQALDGGHPLVERHPPPRRLRPRRPVEHGLDLVRGRQHALGHHRPVDRADRLLDLEADGVGHRATRA